MSSCGATNANPLDCEPGPNPDGELPIAKPPRIVFEVNGSVHEAPSLPGTRHSIHSSVIPARLKMRAASALALDSGSADTAA